MKSMCHKDLVSIMARSSKSLDFLGVKEAMRISSVCREFSGIELPVSAGEVSGVDECEKLANVPRSWVFVHATVGPQATYRVLLKLVTICPNLTVLGINGCKEITKLPETMPKTLRELLLRYTPVTDLSPLSQCLELEELDVTGTGVSDLESLKELSNLHTICAYGTTVTLIPQMKGYKLQKLSVGKTKICQFLGRRLPPSLAELDLAETAISNLRPLAWCTCLTSLDISGCDQVSDITPLTNCSKLRRFIAPDTGIEWIEALKACTGLRQVSLSGCRKLKTIEPLGECKFLKVLNVSYTSVRDFTPLYGCTGLSELCLSVGGRVGKLSTQLKQIVDRGCRVTWY
jgi:hypothetical protein